MGVFGMRQSASWHKSVRTTAADKQPVVVHGQLPHPNPSFPWYHLKEHTDAYFRKKKNLTPEQIEQRLVQFITRNADRIDIAIAACGHKMNHRTLRGLLLTEFNVGPGKNLSMTCYLQAVIAANRVNPQSVTDHEAQGAQSLIAAAVLGSVSVSRYLLELIEILIAGVPLEFLLYTHIHALAHKACLDYVGQLQGLINVGQLQRAYSASSWLSSLAQRNFKIAPENFGAEQLLDSAFPTWKSWAAWKPNQKRLLHWEQFTSTERVALKDLLALEGPDCVGREGTMREGIRFGTLNLSQPVVSFGNLTFERCLGPDIKGSIDRLLGSVDAASMAGPNDVALLISQCAGKTITYESLRLLEVVKTVSDPSLTSLLLSFYGVNNEPRTLRLAAAMRILPILAQDQGHPLRKILTPNLVILVNENLKIMQDNLQAQLTEENALDDIEITLQDFGRELLESAWFLPLLDQNFRSLLEDWPSKGEITSLHKLRATVQSESQASKLLLTKKINDFYTECLIKRGTVDKTTKRLVEALIEIWKEPPNIDLYCIALFMAQDHGVEDKIRFRSLSLLCSMPHSFISELAMIVAKWDELSNPTYTKLGKLLSSIPLTKSDATGYWRCILYKISDRRGRSLIDSLFGFFTPGQWFECISDVHAACAGIESRDPPPPILSPHLHIWVVRAKPYIAAITSLNEDLVGFDPVMECFLLGGEPAFADSLVNILECFKTCCKPNTRPVMMAVLKVSTTDNMSQISKTLFSLSTCTQAGIDACMHILDLHNKKITKRVAEAMLASWLQSANMSQADTKALDTLAELLNLNPKLSTTQVSLEAASDNLA